MELLTGLKGGEEAMTARSKMNKMADKLRNTTNDLNNQHLKWQIGHAAVFIIQLFLYLAIMVVAVLRYKDLEQCPDHIDDAITQCYSGDNDPVVPVVILAFVLIVIRVVLAQLRFETCLKGREHALTKGRNLLAEARDQLELEENMDATSVENFRVRCTVFFTNYSSYVSDINYTGSEASPRGIGNSSAANPVEERHLKTIEEQDSGNDEAPSFLRSFSETLWPPSPPARPGNADQQYPAEDNQSTPRAPSEFQSSDAKSSNLSDDPLIQKTDIEGGVGSNTT